jgi:hypothetical protein
VSLTAVRPDQELLDGLSLDAAWERATALEKERDAALINLRYLHAKYEKASGCLLKTSLALRELTRKDWGLGAEVQAFVTEVERILSEVIVIDD